MMSAADRELEDDILSVSSKLDPHPSDVEELLSLLDKTENVLSRVDQSPSESMFAALQPAMKALVAKDLLEHPDVDVKVHVAACVSEITRITAPDAPYDDDQMKVIFRTIVEAFRNLDDTSSRSFSKRVSILETVAKVRSCVVMLDLECDDMILEMFHHFLKAIRPNHPECVFPSMVMIMTLVLEESEDISSELLSCLLDSIKKDNKETLPITCRLGEKVIGNCAAKLKPYLISYAPGDYSKIVGSICQDNAVALEATEINVSSEIMADDSKLSERTVSDDLPEGSAKLDQEAASPEKVGTSDKSSDRSPRLSNGILQRANGDSVVQPASPKQKPERPRRSGQPKDTVSVDRTDSGNLDSVDANSDGALDLKNKPKMGQDSTEVAQNDSDKDAPSLPSRINGHNKEVDSSQVGVLAGKEAEPSISMDCSENEVQAPHSSDNATDNITSSTPSGNTPDATRPNKRGRPPGSKSSMKKCSNSVLDQSASASVEKEDQGNSQTKDALLSFEESDLKKKLDAASNSEGKSHRRAGKKVPLENVDDAATPHSVTSDSEAKPALNTGKGGTKKKDTKGESSRKQQRSNIMHPKGKIEDENDIAAGSGLKDVPTSPKRGRIHQSKDKSHLEDIVKTNSRRKRSRGTEEISETPDCKPNLDQSLVGSAIQVWWPDDLRFYNGTVDSFDPNTGRHKIQYDDGDLEVLLLKDERYRLGKDIVEAEEDEGKDDTSLIESPKVPQSKKRKTNQNSLPKQLKNEVLLESGMESGRRRGRPKGGSSKVGNLSNDNTKMATKSKERAASISMDEMSKSRSKQHLELGKKSKDDVLSGDDISNTGSKNVSLKAANKSMDLTPKSGRKSRNTTPKTSIKSKEDTLITASKLTDDPMEKTPKTGSKSKDDANNSGRSVRKTKSKEATEGSRKPPLKDSVSSRAGNESSADDSSGREKAKVSENEASLNVQEAEPTTGTGKKRKRKGRN